MSLAEKIAMDTIQKTLYVPMQMDYGKALESKNNKLNYTANEKQYGDILKPKNDLKVGYDMDKKDIHQQNKYFSISSMYSKN